MREWVGRQRWGGWRSLRVWVGRWKVVEGSQGSAEVGSQGVGGSAEAGSSGVTDFTPGGESK